MSSGLCEFRQKGLEFARQASQLDRSHRFEEAARLYVQAAQYLQIACKYEKYEKQKTALQSASKQYTDRASKLQKYLSSLPVYQPTPPQSTASSSSLSSPAPLPTENSGGGVGNDKLRDALQSAIVQEKPNVRWDDIAGLEGAKRSLQEAVIMPMKLPHLFTGKRSPWKGILLYGPPGTGKSYLAKALATEANATFFSVSSSDLVSKWVGESERLVRTLFEMARESKPAIIFVDEVDALCSSRTDSDSDSGRRIKTEFLVQMNGVRGGSDEGVLVLGATNTPWTLDQAIRRRFERRIHIGLPDLNARARMFILHIGKTPCQLDKPQLMELAKRTDGRSGSDIEVLVRDALMAPVRKVQTATHFRRYESPEGHKGAIPCAPEEEGAVAVTWQQIEGGKVIAPPVTFEDFVQALQQTKGSISNDDLEKQAQFTQEFGQEGT